MKHPYRLHLCLMASLFIVNCQSASTSDQQQLQQQQQQQQGPQHLRCNVRIQLSPQHEVEHLLCADAQHVHPDNHTDAFESALRSYLVDRKVFDENATPMGTSQVHSPWFKMESVVARFKEFLQYKYRQQPEEAFVILEPKPTGTALVGETPQERTQPSDDLVRIQQTVRQHMQALLLGRPLGDASELDTVGAFQEAEGFVSVLFKHKQRLSKDSVQPLPSFTVKQRDNRHDELPFTQMKCAASSSVSYGSCVTDRTCWMENLYYYRGKWVVHADGENIYRVKRQDLGGIGSSIYTWPWVARTQPAAGGTEDILLEPSKPFVQLSTHASTGIMGLWSFEIAGDNLRHLRRCKGSSCLNVRTVEDTVVPVMRTEPETFGHLLVDTFYPADWAAHDLNVTLPPKVALVAMDPFDRFTHPGLNKLFGATTPHLRDGDDLCGSKNVTIVLRKQEDGRSFFENDVNQLKRLIHDTFAIPTKLVYLEDFTVEQQVRILHDTAILVCMDGSALDLIPFARDDMAVIVVVPNNRAYGHWRLLQSVGSIDRHYVLLAKQHSEAYRIPLRAARAAVEASLLSLQRAFEQEACNNWWYFSSEAWMYEGISSTRRKNNWLGEAAHVLGLNPTVGCTDYWPEPFDRNGMLRVLQRMLPARRVLEIGCTASSYERFADGGAELTKYVCVDPLSGQGRYKTTSDVFFANASAIEFDLVFIDGLHTSIQAEKDIKNALKILNKNGVIAVHDSNPRHRIESESTYYGTNSWNGDVWRAVVRLQAQMPALNVATLPLDWGLTLVRHATTTTHNAPAVEAYPEKEMLFEVLDGSRLELLNMISICELPDFFEK